LPHGTIASRRGGRKNENDPQKAQNRQYRRSKGEGSNFVGQAWRSLLDKFFVQAGVALLPV